MPAPVPRARHAGCTLIVALWRSESQEPLKAEAAWPGGLGTKASGSQLGPDPMRDMRPLWQSFLAGVAIASPSSKPAEAAPRSHKGFLWHEAFEDLNAEESVTVDLQRTRS